MTTTDDSGRKLAAFVLIGLGVLFLAAQTFSFSLFGMLWPFFVIIPGLGFLYPALTGGKDKAGLAIPGAMVTGTGLILFYQNLTGHWLSWAYIWALYPVLLGFAFTFVGRRTQNSNLYNTGNGFVKWGLMGLIGLWFFFEVLIFGGSSPLVNIILPLVLIGAGAFMLFGRNAITFGESKKKKNVTSYRSRNGYSASEINPDLKRKIDEALAEDDEETEPYNSN